MLSFFFTCNIFASISLRIEIIVLMSVPCSPFLIVFVNLIPISPNLYSLRRSVLLLAVFISIATISFSQHVCFLNNYRINQKFGRGNDDLNLPLPGGDIKEFKTVIVL